MRTSEFNSLAREQLRPLLPSFEPAKGLFFDAPIADLLRGFTFQGSSYDRTSFYLVAFVQPLYVLSDEEILTFSERSPRFLSTNARDDIESFVTGPGRTFLERLRAPADLAEWLESEEAGHKPDPFALEALACSVLLAGRIQEAKRWLDVAAESGATYIRNDIDEGLYTENEEHPLRGVLDRAAGIRRVLAASAHDAIALLEQWREETARNLGLSQYLAPPEGARVRQRNRET